MAKHLANAALNFRPGNSHMWDRKWCDEGMRRRWQGRRRAHDCMLRRRRRGPKQQLFVPAAAFQAGENEWGRGGGLKDALFQLFDK